MVHLNNTTVNVGAVATETRRGFNRTNCERDRKETLLPESDLFPRLPFILSVSKGEGQTVGFCGSGAQCGEKEVQKLLSSH